MSGFTKDWALKCVEGFLVSYFFGKTPLNVVKGVVKRVIESYGVITRRNRSHHKPQNTRPRTKHTEKNEGVREPSLY
jgi:hypothetical protein